METVLASWPLIMTGLRVTLQVSGLVLLIGTVIGLIGGVSLLYGPPLLRWLVRVYVDIIRGIPLLVLLFATFYGLAALGMQTSALVSGVVALSAFCGAHISEVIRGGIGSIPKGQTDAGKAIGLTFLQRLRYVIFPQALSRILPPWVNTAAEMVKASSLISLLSVVDLMLAIQQIVGRTRETLLLYAVAALLYFVINYTISTIGLILEDRFSYS
ncbi:MAG: amino acid ABC transporter permease [Anaerolineales bacterium]|nr:amino acid ABC transporter permease [Anaerolineales bacterium]